MGGVPREHLVVGRVLHEDDDLVTMEVGKRDDVTFHLQQDDRFFTLVFIKSEKDGTARTWKPWEEGA
jgi:hypothetical protein